MMKQAVLVFLGLFLFSALALDSFYDRRFLGTQFRDGHVILTAKAKGATEDFAIVACILNDDDYTLSCYAATDGADPTSLSINYGRSGSVPGPEIFSFSKLENTVTEEFDLTTLINGQANQRGVLEEIVDDFKNGQYYVLLTTANGSVRGQLGNFDGLVAYLDPSQITGIDANGETDDDNNQFDPESSGLALFSYDRPTGRLSYVIIHTVDPKDLLESGIFLRQFGFRGEEVIHFERTHSPIIESAQLDADLENNLLASFLYVNIRSQTWPKGEIRGQIIPNTPIPKLTHTALLEPVEGVLTRARGCALFAYNCRTHLLEYYINHNVRNAFKVQIQKKGVKLFNAKPTNSPIIGSFRLTVDDQNDFTDEGEITITIFSDDFPNGELTGFVTNDQYDYAAYLQSSEVVTEYEQTSAGSGCALFSWDHPNNLLQYNIQHDLLESTVKNTEIAVAEAGAAGNVAFVISDERVPIVSGVHYLNRTNENSLRKEELVVQVNTFRHPYGELRGQIQKLRSSQCTVVGGESTFDSTVDVVTSQDKTPSTNTPSSKIPDNRIISTSSSASTLVVSALALLAVVLAFF